MMFQVSFPSLGAQSRAMDPLLVASVSLGIRWFVGMYGGGGGTDLADGYCFGHPGVVGRPLSWVIVVEVMTRSFGALR